MEKLELFAKPRKHPLPSVLDIDQDDLSQAIMTYEAREAAGVWSDEDFRTIVHKLSNPDPFYLYIHKREEGEPISKALPKPKEDNIEKVQTQKNSGQKVGSGGQNRYSYPDENAKKQAKQSTPKAQGQEIPDNGGQHPDTEPQSPQAGNPPNPSVQDPIPAQEGEQPSPKEASPTEFANQLGISVKTLQTIANQFKDDKDLKGKQGFIDFMRVQTKEVLEKHHLDSDYLGLLYDAILSPKALAPPPQGQNPGAGGAPKQPPVQSPKTPIK